MKTFFYSSTITLQYSEKSISQIILPAPSNFFMLLLISALKFTLCDLISEICRSPRIISYHVHDSEDVCCNVTMISLMIFNHLSISYHKSFDVFNSRSITRFYHVINEAFRIMSDTESLIFDSSTITAFWNFVFNFSFFEFDFAVGKQINSLTIAGLRYWNWI